MPLKVDVGLCRKVGEANYGSRGGSVNLELELDGSLIGEPEKLHERIRQLFNLVRASLAEELNGHGNGHANTANTAPSSSQDNGQRANGDGQSQNTDSKSNGPRAATQSQVKALYAITKSQGLNLRDLLRDRHQVNRPEDLSIKQASGLIESLKSNERQNGR